MVLCIYKYWAVGRHGVCREIDTRGAIPARAEGRDSLAVLGWVWGKEVDAWLPISRIAAVKRYIWAKNNILTTSLKRAADQQRNNHNPTEVTDENRPTTRLRGCEPSGD